MDVEFNSINTDTLEQRPNLHTDSETEIIKNWHAEHMIQLSGDAADAFWQARDFFQRKEIRQRRLHGVR